MANPFHIPSGSLRELRPNYSEDSASGRLRAVASQHAAARVDIPSAPPPANVDIAGPRKLVRPKLPPGTLRARATGLRHVSPVLTHQAAMTMPPDDGGSHSEAFYFQKQVQTQTLMVFVLEAGEQIEGYIEWYDRDAIKIRGSSRTLVYKAAIKYLYKAAESHGGANGLKKVRSYPSVQSVDAGRFL